MVRESVIEVFGWRDRSLEMERVVVSMFRPQYGNAVSEPRSRWDEVLEVVEKFVRVLDSLTVTPYSGIPLCMILRNFSAWGLLVVIKRKSSMRRRSRESLLESKRKERCVDSRSA